MSAIQRGEFDDPRSDIDIRQGGLTGDGSMKTANRLLNCAGSCDTTADKFQAFKAEELVSHTLEQAGFLYPSFWMEESTSDVRTKRQRICVGLRERVPPSSLVRDHEHGPQCRSHLRFSSGVQSGVALGLCRAACLHDLTARPAAVRPTAKGEHDGGRRRDVRHRTGVATRIRNEISSWNKHALRIVSPIIRLRTPVWDGCSSL